MNDWPDEFGKGFTAGSWVLADGTGFDAAPESSGPQWLTYDGERWVPSEKYHAAASARSARLSAARPSMN
jgi:hypothetical protein